jgi:hypothetical protein
MIIDGKKILIHFFVLTLTRRAKCCIMTLQFTSLIS